MKLQFDAKQPYQIDAVSVVADLFDGQPLNKPVMPWRRSSAGTRDLLATLDQPSRVLQTDGVQLIGGERRFLEL